MPSSPVTATASDDLIVRTLLDILPKDPRDWELIGIVNKDRDLFTFGTDSKIVGRAFEVVATAYVKELASTLGMKFGESEQQTVYPDFVLTKPNGRKIAVDVKSTYRKRRPDGSTAPFKFTLGSFTSYLRNGTKNIVGHYDDYDGHYVLAFLYSRTDSRSATKTSLDDIGTISPAYQDVEVVFQEKFRVAGEKKGSGNTDNIATFSATSMEPFAQGASPFAALGEHVFEHYWRNYPKYRDTAKEKESLYTSLIDYFEWLRRIDDPPFDPDELQATYAQHKNAIAGKDWGMSLS